MRVVAAPEETAGYLIATFPPAANPFAAVSVVAVAAVVGAPVAAAGTTVALLEHSKHSIADLPNRHLGQTLMSVAGVEEELGWANQDRAWQPMDLHRQYHHLDLAA